MQDIFAVALPFFALVGCGWLAARAGWLPLSALPGLNAFTLYFALPALLFRLGASGTLVAGLHLGPVLVYGCAGLMVTSLVWWRQRRASMARLDAAFAALTAAFPNSGFLGLPLLMGLLGSAAAGPVACTLLVDVFVISSLCLALSQQADASHPLHMRLATGLRTALANPLPWAIAAGVLAGMAGVAPSGPLDRMLHMLGDAASPVALFALGAMLERARRGAGGEGVATRGKAPAARHDRRGEMLMVLSKLVLHPALVLGLSSLAARSGLGEPLNSVQTTALVLTAALPCAANVSLLAERFGADTAGVARTIVWSTVISLGSFTAWAGGMRALGL